jgi:hypothetical protein
MSELDWHDRQRDCRVNRFLEKRGASSTFFLYALALVPSWLFAYYFVSRNEAAYFGTNKSFLEGKASRSRTSQQAFPTAVAVVATAVRVVFLM